MSEHVEQKEPDKMSDEELSDSMREQINLSRNSAHGHNRKFTRKLAAEMASRGWNKSKQILKEP